jgi:hypothetical protein
LNKKKIIGDIFIWSLGTFISLLLLGVILTYVFKDKIIGAAISEINKNLNTKVDIDPHIDLSVLDKFPQVSLRFKNVKVYESIPNSSQLLGQADNLYLTFDIWNILKREYVINKLYLEDGSFHLKVNKNGQNNFTILKPDTSRQTSQGSLELSNISLKNILVTYLNETNEQFYEVQSHKLQATFKIKQDKYLINLEGPQLIHNIKIHEGEYFKNKEIYISSQLEYDDDEKSFRILPTTIRVEKSDFLVEGIYVFKNNNVIDIKIDNNQGTIHTLLSLIPKRLYENFAAYESDGEVYFHATIKGIVTEKQNAAVNVEFGCRNASLFHPDLKNRIKDANFTGLFTNGELRNARTSQLKLENIRFDFDNKMIQGNFLYKNFDNPYIAFDATGSLHAASVLDFVKIPGIQSAAGGIDFDIDFKGFLNDLKTKAGHSRIETNGEVTLQNLSVIPSEANYRLEGTNGTFLFNKNDIAITDFTTRAGKSDFQVNGLLKNLFGAIMLENGRMLADLQIRSNLVDVEELLSFTGVNSKDDEVKKGRFPYLEKYVMVLDCSVKNISYKKVKVNSFSGSLSFDQPLMRADNLRCNIAGGKINLNSRLDFDSEQKIATTIRAHLHDINIDSLLYMFDNFGQSFITHDNLKGEFTGEVETAFSWNSNGDIDTKGLVASIDCSILKGELNNFEPMQKLSRFIDAYELAHIRFSELKNKIFIENRVISLPEMQILSNVSDISVSGTHTFDHVMDYKLSVPLKNLKKPKIDKDASFGAIENDQKQGSTLFLTIKGSTDNYKIGYDTKRTKNKIQEDLKKEKQEFKNLFKRKEEEVSQSARPNEEEFFDFD